MRLGWVPPPTYPEYPELLAQAQRNARGPLDPASIPRKQALIGRRGRDWCFAVLGRECSGLGHISCVDAELLVLADAAGIDPPLPQWLLDERAETARRRAEREEAKAKLRKMDEDAWEDARKRCPVNVDVRQNPKARVRRGEWHNLGHAVPRVDVVSGARRQHRAGRPLCETATRARPIALGDPVDVPVTCERCLTYVPKIRVVASV